MIRTQTTYGNIIHSLLSLAPLPFYSSLHLPVQQKHITPPTLSSSVLSLFVFLKNYHPQTSSTHLSLESPNLFEISTIPLICMESPTTHLTTKDKFRSANIALVLLPFLAIFPQAMSHGVLADPNQRGSLQTSKFIPNGVDKTNTTALDTRGHFPAGSKANIPGAAITSQIEALQGALWKPFTPLSKTYTWFAGVCGDLKTKPFHLKPQTERDRRRTNFYNDGMIARTYVQGGVINIELTLAAHHNGFIEFHICDVSKCEGGDISESCFRDGHCHRLRRAANPICDSGEIPRCGPIDPRYPGRWYLPCSVLQTSRGNIERFGGLEGTIQYLLPKDLYCEHCVLQWYWTTANTCNPPGVEEYFTDNFTKPEWGNCRGQNGAKGGYTRIVKPCGTSTRRQHYPEQYLQCADVRIESRDVSPLPSVRPVPSKEIDKMTQSASPSPLSSASVQSSPSMSWTASVSASMSATPRASLASKMSPSQSPVVFIMESTTPSPTVLLPYSLPPSSSATSSPSPVTEGDRFRPYDPKKGMKQSSGAIRDIIFIGDEQRIVSLHDVKEVNVSSYRRVSIEVLTGPKKRFNVKEVKFFVNGQLRAKRRSMPYFISGVVKGKANPWRQLILGRKVDLRVRAVGTHPDTDRVSVTFRGKLKMT